MSGDLCREGHFLGKGGTSWDHSWLDTNSWQVTSLEEAGEVYCAHVLEPDHLQLQQPVPALP